MSTFNFAYGLLRQVHGSTFDYLAQELGPELISGIPTVAVDSASEDEYPAPWDKPELLPADIVKSVLPSGRPILAVRYFHTEDNKTDLILEIFFQRYSSQQAPQLRRVDELGLHSVLTMDFSAKFLVSNFAVRKFSGDSIFDSKNPSATFQMIKDLASGAPLEKTDGRYLPMYASQFRV